MKNIYEPLENIIALNPAINLNTLKESLSTPITDKIIEKAEKLSKVSKYPCNFDFEVYRQLELRFKDGPVRGGIIFKSPFRLVNAHPTCQQCLYAFEVDTYGRGCLHDCIYCYAKDTLQMHGFWNKPIPFPVDISELWQVFHTVFETTKESKWRNILEKKIPLRIGSMSDSFMHMDRKFKVTQELLKILNYYKYPYIIFTRSDLIGRDEYLKLLNNKLCSVQMSISSTNNVLTRKIEPGAPPAKKRLEALSKLVKEGFWTTVRINPLFPTHPNGYFTDPDFDKNLEFTPFEFFSFDMIDEIAKHNVQSVLTGFVRLSGFALNNIYKATDIDLRPFFGEKKFSRSSNYHYSDKEIRFYYQKIKERCDKNGVQFTTCYIGNGENHFWKDQDLWSNKTDCCNAKNRISEFKNDSRSIKWDDRIKHVSSKHLTPNDPQNLNTPLL